MQTLLIDVQTSVPENSVSLAITIELTLNAVGELQALAAAELFGGTPGDRSGLLFGAFESGVVRVEAVRQLPPKGQTSALARLSPKQFDELIRIAREDPVLENSYAVGWYRFHSATELTPDDTEIEFHHKFFPRADHIGMILRARDADTMQALLCTRSQDGSFSRTQQNCVSILLRGDDAVNVTMNIHTARRLEDDAYLKAYQVLSATEGEKSRSRLRRFVLAGIATTIVAIAVLSASLPWNKQRESPAPESRLFLNVAGNGRSLLINWSGGSHDARSAQLRIFDGNEVRDVDITSQYQPTGSVTVQRQSGNVQVILFVNNGTQTLQSQSSLIDEAFKSSTSSFVKPSNPADGVAELETLKQRNMQLEALVKVLRKRIENEAYRTRR